MKTYRIPFALFFLIVALFTLSLSSHVSAAVNPEKQAEKFLTAFQKKDFKTLTDMTYFYQVQLRKHNDGLQRGIAEIEAKNPKVLWPKLTKEFKEIEEAKWTNFETFFKRTLTEREAVAWQVFSAPTSKFSLMDFFMPPNSWKVIESRKKKQRVDGQNRDVNVVYVSIKYKKVEESPLASGRLLKEAIITLSFDVKTGQLLEPPQSHHPTGDVYWDNAPLKIINAALDAPVFSDYKHKPILGGVVIQVVGGRPPYTSRTTCGGQEIEKMYNVSTDGGIIKMIYSYPHRGAKLFLGEFDVACQVKVTDGAGQEDNSDFVVPAFTFGSTFCWVANPWFLYRQGAPEVDKFSFFIETGRMEECKFPIDTLR